MSLLQPVGAMALPQFVSHLRPSPPKWALVFSVSPLWQTFLSAGVGPLGYISRVKNVRIIIKGDGHEKQRHI
jgi:hypothetical protein